MILLSILNTPSRNKSPTPLYAMVNNGLDRMFAFSDKPEMPLNQFPKCGRIPVLPLATSISDPGEAFQRLIEFRVMSQLFQRKPIAALVAETEGAGGLKRSLRAGDLIMLAIGAVIGAGIFGAIGTAAAGQLGPHGEVIRAGAGPALVLSFVLLGGACALAGLCYAELASMIPQAGSAYAYSYATLGELVAWIIG